MPTAPDRCRYLIEHYGKPEGADFWWHVYCDAGELFTFYSSPSVEPLVTFCFLLAGKTYGVSDFLEPDDGRWLPILEAAARQMEMAAVAEKQPSSTRGEAVLVEEGARAFLGGGQ